MNNLLVTSGGRMWTKLQLLCFATICIIRLCLRGLQMLWRYAKKSVVLRIRYLVTQPKGADSNTVLVQDIPGVAFGTQAARAKTLAPAAIANKVTRRWLRS